MTLRTEPWTVGTPCWADLTTPDVEAAKAFYSAVLGWSYPGTEAEHGGYAIAQVDGHAAAGIGPQPEGSHAAWLLYLASEDADATAAAVTPAGGTVVLPPGDVGEMGRMAVAMDPTGAVFGIWQAGTHVGAEHVNAPGGLTWEDLRTPDPDTARAFYGGVFGLEATPMEMAPADYTTIAQPGGEPLGGIGSMMGADDAPPHWLVYFGVADTVASVAAAVEGGGSVLMEPVETPFGTMAGLADPDGAVFWVVQMPSA